MSKIDVPPIVISLLAAVLLSAATTHAETVNCTAVTAVPATISAPGLYCLTGDLATSITSGAAITINANSVTLDLNGWKLGGLGGGTGTLTAGIYSTGRQNITIRNGTIRGFYRGIYFLSGSGHVLEDLRLDGNTRYGIYINGTSTVIRRNQILDTGGTTTTSNPDAHGIYTLGEDARVVDNEITGTTSIGATAGAIGMRVQTADGAVVANNNITGLNYQAGGYATGIFYASGASGIIDNNRVSIPSGSGGSSAISINGTHTALCRNNIAIGFTNATFQCNDGGGNVVIP